MSELRDSEATASGVADASGEDQQDHETVIANQARRISNLRREIGYLQAQLEMKERPEPEVREENARLRSSLTRATYLLERVPALKPKEIEAVLEDLNKPGSTSKHRLGARDKLRIALERFGATGQKAERSVAREEEDYFKETCL